MHTIMSVYNVECPSAPARERGGAGPDRVGPRTGVTYTYIYIYILLYLSLSIYIYIHIYIYIYIYILVFIHLVISLYPAALWTCFDEPATKTTTETESAVPDKTDIAYTSRCVRVILAQGPCYDSLHLSNVNG